MQGNSSDVQLVVVGSIGIYNIQTPYTYRENLLGGSVSYACSSASFFTKVGMVGVVGEDFSPDYVDLYHNIFGIDTAGLKQVSGNTFRWSGVYEDDMINRRTISTELNVFADFQPELPEEYRSAPFILLGNILPELQLKVLSQVKSPRFVVADTMDMWISMAREKLMEVISRVNMLMLNDSEIRLLTGEHSLVKAASHLLDMGPQYVVIKKGEHGAMLFSRSGIFIVPAYPIDEVKDPTGAGDSFAGGFMGMLACKRMPSDQNVRDALIHASVTASFTVEDFSLDRLRGIGKQEINDRVAKLRKMISVN